jgi:hypothetical protein
MYPSVLLLHSWLRWAVLAVALWTVLRAATGVFGPRQWTPADSRAGKWLGIGVDVEMLIGLVLYGALSPITRNALSDMGAAMGDRVLRFWAVEHPALMVAAVALVHVGRSRARKARFDDSKHKQALIFFGLALLAMLAATPWPWMAAGRSLFHFG